MTRLEAIVTALNRWLKWVAGGFLLALMLVTVVNIILRFVHKPFAGAAALVGWLAAPTAAFALGYTQLQKGHTRIDIIISRFPPRVQSIIDSIMFFVGTGFFGVATWQVVKLAGRYRQLGQVCPTTGISYHPFIYAVAIGCALLCLVLLLDFLKSLVQAVKR
ncbi:MAG: TRAP transporter small permease [Dehalococcoidia bacterium]